jgi:hypothetical protein
MLERLGRLCVGLGLVWILSVVGWWLLVGVEGAEEVWPYLQRVMSAGVWGALHFALTFVVTPIGMLVMLRDLLGDPGPLWLKLAAPGAFAAVYALFLAAAAPEVGRPMLLTADPVVARILPGTLRSRSSAAGASGAGIPGGLGLLAGLLSGGNRH